MRGQWTASWAQSRAPRPARALPESEKGAHASTKERTLATDIHRPHGHVQHHHATCGRVVVSKIKRAQVARCHARLRDTGRNLPRFAARFRAPPALARGLGTATRQRSTKDKEVTVSTCGRLRRRRRRQRRPRRARRLLHHQRRSRNQRSPRGPPVNFVNAIKRATRTSPP